MVYSEELGWDVIGLKWILSVLGRNSYFAKCTDGKGRSQQTTAQKITVKQSPLCHSAVQAT